MKNQKFINNLYKEVSIISLLDYSPETLLTSPTLLKKILQLFLFITDEAIMAFEAFTIAQDANSFDAHVGDTLCQIRAHMILWLFQNSSDLQGKLISSYKELKHVRSQTTNLLEYLHIPHTQRFKKCMLFSYLNDNKITCNINGLLLLLTKAHFLSRFKTLKVDGNIVIDYKKLTQNMQVSKSSIRRIVHLFQKQLSFTSTEYMRFIAHNNQNTHISQLIPELILQDEEERYVLPTYLVMMNLYQDTLRRKWPMLIVLHRKYRGIILDKLSFLFRYDEEINDYVFQPTAKEHELNSHCMVYSGETIYGDGIEDKQNFINRFVKTGLLNIIFANMAIHPQFSGKKLSCLAADPYKNIIGKHTKQTSPYSEIVLYERESLYRDYLRHKEMADTIGCSQRHKHLFFIRHIYSDKIQHVIDGVTEFNHTLSLTEKLKQLYFDLQDDSTLLAMKQNAAIPNSCMKSMVKEQPVVDVTYANQ